MSAARPSEGARPLHQEGVRDAASAASLGEAYSSSAARPSEGARLLHQEGVRDAASAASLGEVIK